MPNICDSHTVLIMSINFIICKTHLPEIERLHHNPCELAEVEVVQEHAHHRAPVVRLKQRDVQQMARRQVRIQHVTQL